MDVFEGEYKPTYDDWMKRAHRAEDEVERLQARVADFESGRVYQELQDKINKRRAAMADIAQDVKALTDRISWWDAVLVGEEV